MNKHSILFKLNILFAIALVATVVASFSIVAHIAKRDNADLVYKARILLKEMRQTRSKPVALLKEFDLVQVEGRRGEEVRKGAKFHRLRPNRHNRPKRYHILRHEGNTYLDLNLRHTKLLLQEKRSFVDKFALPIIIFVGTMFLLIVMYILLRRSLIPLRGLQKDIIAYGDGRLPDYSISNKKDEISLLSNAFYQAIEKSNTLVESRKLFLRNIFHELNTPITKGKILAEIVDEKATKQMLDSIFSRLSSLLLELAQMEEITAGDYLLDRKDIRIIELIDQARDWLYIDEEIESPITDETLNVDFHMMSIVFKNLIDNAQKYGSDLNILYDRDRISFISRGEKLNHPLEYFKQAFTKGDRASSQKGFGLGLYIVHEILQKHDMGFEYRYEDGINEFILVPNLSKISHISVNGGEIL